MKLNATTEAILSHKEIFKTTLSFSLYLMCTSHIQGRYHEYIITDHFDLIIIGWTTHLGL